MKNRSKVWLALSCFLFVFISFTTAQTYLADIQVDGLNGERVNTRSILDNRIPVVIAFWSTTCKPCLQELDAFTEKWEEWQKKVRFKIVAVSTDDARSTAKVRTIVAANSWPFTILLDKNQNFKRAMNVNTIPYLYIIDANGTVVYSSIGYNTGRETKVLEILKGL